MTTARRRHRLTPFGRALVIVVAMLAVTRDRVTDPSVGALVFVSTVLLVVVGIVWPLAVSHATDVSIDALVPDLQVGRAAVVSLSLTSNAPRSLVDVRLVAPMTSAWVPMASPGTHRWTMMPEQRGAFVVARVETRCTYPLGVFTSTRVVEVPLPSRVLVAPKVFVEANAPDEREREEGEGRDALAHLGGDVVRSVRPYRLGDPPRRVHWSSTARAGELMVREFDPVPQATSVIVVDLRIDGEATDASAGYEPDADHARVENAVSWAAGVAAAALIRGDHVVLCTRESAGPMMEQVRSELELGRRLAMAVVGEPAEPSEAMVQVGVVTRVTP